MQFDGREPAGLRRGKRGCSLRREIEHLLRARTEDSFVLALFSLINSFVDFFYSFIFFCFFSLFKKKRFGALDAANGVGLLHTSQRRANSKGATRQVTM